MSNKDSFTFSDKLKRSKSLPLSKRIPSKVGGDGKAKRTLIQRAQRDLPFIIVAAAALLLLPILSREPKAGFEGGHGYDDLFTGESVAGLPTGPAEDLRPTSGFRDPLSMIVRPKSGEDGEGIKMVDTFVEDESSPKFAAPDTGAARPTTVFQPAAARSVRSSAPRAATVLGTLRSSQTIGAGGRSGASLTLATGTAPRGGAPAAAREGVRPVALQPVSSAGRGGRGGFEDGYGEMARSLMAMNKGPAKQAIFAAQLGDVDGTPLGAAGYGRDARGRDGVGGAPNNRVDHKSYLPWWWDFEKMKAMKHWELWHYNWEKALSDSLIKMATGLFQCLVAGKADGSVGNFIGTPAGDDSDICVDADGKPLKGAQNFRDWASQMQTTSSGDNPTTGTSATWEGYMLYCKSKGGAMNSDGTAKTDIDSSSYKGFFQTRIRCLGGRWGDMMLGKLFASMKKAEISEESNCRNVENNTGIMQFNAKTSSKAFVGKDSFQSRRVGHYVVMVDASKVDSRYKVNTSDTQKIFDESGKTLTAVASPEKEEDKTSDKDKMFKNGFIGFIGHGGKLDGKALNNHIQRLNKNYPGSDFRATKVVGFIGDQGKVQEHLPALIDEVKNNGMLTIGESELKKLLGINSKRTATCTIGAAFLHTDFKNLFHKGLKKDSQAIKCGPNTENIVEMTPVLNDRSRHFSATITNPGQCVYAAFIERSDFVGDEYMVKNVVNFVENVGPGTKGQGVNEHGITKCTTDEKGNKVCTYSFNHIVALDEKTQTGDTGKGGKGSTDNIVWEVPFGNGYVIWITDDDESCDKLPQRYNKYKKTADGNMVGATVSEPSAKEIMADLYSAGGQRWTTCAYKWGCEGQLCPEAPKGNFCYTPDGKIYKAGTAGSLTLRISQTETSFEEVFGKPKPSDGTGCLECIENAIKETNINVPLCDAVCEDDAGGLWRVALDENNNPKKDGEGRAVRITPHTVVTASNQTVITDLKCDKAVSLCYNYELKKIVVSGTDKEATDEQIKQAAGSMNVDMFKNQIKQTMPCPDNNDYCKVGSKVYLLRNGTPVSEVDDLERAAFIIRTKNPRDCDTSSRNADVADVIISECEYTLAAAFQVNEHATGMLDDIPPNSQTKLRMFDSASTESRGSLVISGREYDIAKDPNYFNGSPQSLLGCIEKNKVSATVLVQGHASKDTRNDDKNTPLSEARAITAAKLLAQQLRMDLSDQNTRAKYRTQLNALSSKGVDIPFAITPSIIIAKDMTSPGNGWGRPTKVTVSISQAQDGYINPSFLIDSNPAAVEKALLQGTALIIKNTGLTFDQIEALSVRVIELYKGSKANITTTSSMPSLLSLNIQEDKGDTKSLEEMMADPKINEAAANIVDLWNLIKASQQKLTIEVVGKGSSMATAVGVAADQRIEVSTSTNKDIEQKFAAMLQKFDFNESSMYKPTPVIREANTQEDSAE